MTTIEGIKCYAPQALKDSSSSFPEASFEALYLREAGHFWFKARNKIIMFLVEKFLGSRDARFLEFGCGTGFVLSGLSKFKNLHLSGADLHIAGLKIAKHRLPNVEFVQFEATQFPFVEEYDAIGAFDVLEHIEADEKTIAEVFSALKKGGHFFLTVPQHRFLWSEVDEISCHKRRYQKNEMYSKLVRAGFKVELMTSFVSSLFPFLLLSRLGRNRSLKKKEQLLTQEIEINPTLNFLFGLAMKIDVILIKLGLSLPFGGSLAVVASKPSK